MFAYIDVGIWYRTTGYRYSMNSGRLRARRGLTGRPYYGSSVPRDGHGQIQQPAEEDGFAQEEDTLDDRQRADLTGRAVRTATSSSRTSSTEPATSGSSTKVIKDDTTWKDVEIDS